MKGKTAKNEQKTNQNDADVKFNTEEAGRYLGLANSETLAVWRCNGRYNIPFIRVGRLVRYRKSDLDAWLESRTVRSDRD